ncbi:MAG TPA: hypothetical protein VFN96_07665 [Gemmatimonadales bacterium]|nr:hypothetical protein [Gemmatimonadales bacterium]
MRARTLVAAAVAAGIWAAARSTPAGSDAGADPARTPAGAESAPVASDLEAGRDPRQILPRLPEQEAVIVPAALTRRAVRGKPPAPVGHDHAATLAEVSPEITTTATAASALTLARAPSAAPASAPGIRSAGEDLPRPAEPVSSRGSMVLIRGGRGTADDDCAIHGQRGRWPGSSINRSAPSLLGGSAGGGGGGGGGMFRGGIR